MTDDERNQVRVEEKMGTVEGNMRVDGEERLQKVLRVLVVDVRVDRDQLVPVRLLRLVL